MIKSLIADATVRNEQLVSTRRKAIVDAAVVILGQKGFSATRTQEIAQMANVTQGTLYNYIRTKEDILYLICDEIATARTAALDAALAKTTRPYDRLLEVLRSMISTYFDFPVHSAIVFRETNLLPEPIRNRMRQRFADHINGIQSVLVEANDAGVCNIENTQLMANMITFLPSVLSLRSWYANHSKEREKTTKEMLHFMLSGLGIKEFEKANNTRHQSTSASTRKTTAKMPATRRRSAAD